LQPDKLLSTNSNPGNDNIIAKGGKTRYQTVMVYIGDQAARILLDNGSGRTFITEDFAKRAKLSIKCAQELVVTGAIGSKRNLISTTMATGFMTSWDKSSRHEMNFRVVKSFAFKSLPAFNREQLEEYKQQGLVIQDISNEQLEKSPITTIV